MKEHCNLIETTRCRCFLSKAPNITHFKGMGRLESDAKVPRMDVCLLDPEPQWMPVIHLPLTESEKRQRLHFSRNWYLESSHCYLM